MHIFKASPGKKKESDILITNLIRELFNYMNELQRLYSNFDNKFNFAFKLQILEIKYLLNSTKKKIKITEWVFFTEIKKEISIILNCQSSE